MTQNNKQTVAVIGAGAVGLLYGSQLLKANHRVEFQTRSGAAKINEEGLYVESIWGNTHLPAQAFANSAEMQKADLILVTTKALPEVDYRNLIAPVLKPTSTIVLLQNGIGVEENLRQLFPQNPIVGGLAFVCVSRIAPNRISHLDYGHVILAPLDTGSLKGSEQAKRIFEEAGIPTRSEDDLRRARWQKLLWNVPFNPLSVVLGGVSTAKMIADEKCVALCLDLMREVVAIASSDGHPLEPGAPEDMIEKTRAMKPYKTSMLLDYESGRPLESQAILGSPLGIAEKLGMPAPKMDMLHAELLFMEKHRQIS